MIGLQAAKSESEDSTIYQGMTMVFKQIEDFLSDQFFAEKSLRLFRQDVIGVKSGPQRERGFEEGPQLVEAARAAGVSNAVLQPYRYAAPAANESDE